MKLNNSIMQLTKPFKNFIFFKFHIFILSQFVLISHCQIQSFYNAGKAPFNAPLVQQDSIVNNNFFSKKYVIPPKYRTLDSYNRWKNIDFQSVNTIDPFNNRSQNNNVIIHNSPNLLSSNIPLNNRYQFSRINFGTPLYKLNENNNDLHILGEQNFNNAQPFNVSVNNVSQNNQIINPNNNQVLLYLFNFVRI